MKIKLLRDIIGLKKGEIANTSTSTSQTVIVEKEMEHTFTRIVIAEYNLTYLLNNGYAEEVKDEIDVEWIRKQKYFGASFLSIKELNFFIAYRVVKAVIEKLNDGWEPDWNEPNQIKTYVSYDCSDNKLYDNNWSTVKTSVLPCLKDRESAQKLIKLCTPELKILFNVK